MRKHIVSIVMLLVGILVLSGCTTTPTKETSVATTVAEVETSTESTAVTETSTQVETTTQEETTTKEETTTTQEETTTREETTTQEETTTKAETTTQQETKAKKKRKNGKKLVVIDAGHQSKGNYEKEPIGPGAKEKKAKVSSGTQGKYTKITEYELALDVAKKLQKELESRGYQVIMTRTSHNVNISNSERAAIANDNNADAFIRIHANGSENTSKKGAFTICQTKNNPYNGELYSQSKALAKDVLDGFIKETGAKRLSIWETDTMSGINWAKVPTTIIEMGYMSNKEEDKLMATDEYREKMVLGMANGLEKFLENN